MGGHHFRFWSSINERLPSVARPRNHKSKIKKPFCMKERERDRERKGDRKRYENKMKASCW